MELLIKIDDKGRILIPVHIRRKLGLKRVVKMRVEENKLIIESVENPIEVLVQTVVKGSKNIEEEIADFRKISEREGLKRVRERWL